MLDQPISRVCLSREPVASDGAEALAAGLRLYEHLQTDNVNSLGSKEPFAGGSAQDRAHLGQIEGLAEEVGNAAAL